MNVYLRTHEIKTLIDGLTMAVEFYHKDINSLRLMGAPAHQIDEMEKLIKSTLKLISNLQETINT